MDVENNDVENNEDDINDINNIMQLVNVPFNIIEDEPQVADPTYQSLLTRYNQLKSSFDYVCKKYTIVQCSSCKKYRRDIVKCVCGITYCRKCDPIIDRNCRVTVFIRCHVCGIMLCENCSADTCSECSKSICRKQECGGYRCTGSHSGCTSIICCPSPCPICHMIWCGNCVVGHPNCNPQRCSCSILVYLRENLILPIIERNIIIQLPTTGPVCTLCGKTSCSNCELSGKTHRAKHAMMPFLIHNARGELPCELPTEILFAIWEYLVGQPMRLK
jgi:hypothetical protein